MMYEIDIKSKRIYNGVCGCQWTQKDHCGRQKFEGHYPNVILIIKYCFTIKEFQWNWNVRIGYDGTSTSVCNILLELYLSCKNYYSHNIGFLYIRVFIRIPIFCRHLQKHIWELLNMKFEYTIVAYITIHVNLDSDLSALWQMISNEESSFVYLEIHFYCLIFNKWS